MARNARTCTYSNANEIPWLEKCELHQAGSHHKLSISLSMSSSTWFFDSENSLSSSIFSSCSFNRSSRSSPSLCSNSSVSSVMYLRPLVAREKATFKAPLLWKYKTLEVYLKVKSPYAHPVIVFCVFISIVNPPPLRHLDGNLSVTSVLEEIHQGVIRGPSASTRLDGMTESPRGTFYTMHWSTRNRTVNWPFVRCN